ncbi:50S ribosomal subunit protein L20 [Candidatus Nasuia deltocephalinicola]|uniref:50S ribosomal protein L20 n=1 Tax=Candidatus Nasuia deltocephalincola TaxID=1160784 RepID=A0A974WMZ8_9PROT|nr:50S ribosomal protein L20 [Candidatus Nasuia deltocephalinicola]WKD87081.1 50S ribosomal protein L20 [Candidatus Nasuia deltocephalinicola]BEH03855.1 50S ribosomal subunit protein L20 [Candidatus Nasuia deltocephalinicola]
MTRVKRGLRVKKFHKKIFYLSKGYIGRRKNVYKISKQSILKAFFYSYRDRKVKKRFFRSFWILFINFFLNIYNFNYSFFIYCLKINNFIFNRKSLYIIFKNYFDFVKFINLIFFYYYYIFYEF